MALQKTPVSINFGKGIDTKTDPYQINISNFAALQNSVFTTTGRLTKRNGFDNITSLPDNQQTTLTTLNDNLIATGSNLYAFSEETDQWLNQGTIQPAQLNTLPLVRNSTSQTSPDTATTPEGLTCLVYTDGATSYYQISDSITGQQIKGRTLLATTCLNPRAFILGPYFIMTFIASVVGTPTLQFVAIPTASPTDAPIALNISADIATTSSGYDAYSVNNLLYIAWEGSATTVKIATLSQALTVSSPVTVAASMAKYISVTPDITVNRIWVSWWSSATANGFSRAYTYVLNPVMTAAQIITATVITELTSIATGGVLTVFYENLNSYTYTDATGDAIRTDFITRKTVTLAGVVSAGVIILRSVGLASKPFIADNGTIYLMVTYGDLFQINPLDNSNQPTYFLIDSNGNIYMRLAYSNGGGYLQSEVLPSIYKIGTQYFYPYLVADFLATVNKGTALPTGTPTNAIYTQHGVNLAKFSIDVKAQYSSEIAGALHLTGGQLWEYDGVKPVEHGFHVWPENVRVTTVASGGNIATGTYNYVATYEWTDNQGNLHRSAPSIPVSVTTGGTATNTIQVPTLRLTYKISPNPVRIVIYRWSVAQPVYYQITSITSPIINDTTIDSITYVDTASDLSILGQTLLYTTGGVIENIAAPASIASALFKNRLFIIDAEDRNLLWCSKQVIENTPVEMSDLLTLYIAPTSGAQGSTGPMTALSAMDDKLIIFKKDAIYYLTGTGPDNTGANNDFTDPIFITSSVGCANPSSIVLMPNGIMFQSDKGIWLLGRDLGTTYIGAPVEAYNSQTIMSATSIPGTNQVRFILSNNLTLMYDYFFNEWGTHTNVFAISATLYHGLHTYLNSFGQVFQETPGLFMDGSIPVLMSLTTAWINIAGLQGYERFYFLYLLGTYYTPFTLNILMAYNYNPGPSQSVLVQPDNFTPNWGGEAVWGADGPWGGPGNVFQERIFPQIQKCESFQITINENYDPSFGIPSGQGLTLSGMNMVVGVKRGFRTQKASRSFG